MADWRSSGHLARHFRLHRRRLGVRTLAEYDASARETIGVGVAFEYRDPGSHAWRVGYYDPNTERVTALSDDEVDILTHFRCREVYVMDVLPGSTYA